VALLIFYTLLSGRAAALSDEFQSYLPTSTAEEASNTGYQGLSLMAGFLPVYLLATFNRLPQVGIRRICLLLAAFVPVLLIGGRSAVVALFLVLIFWTLANVTSSARHRLVTAALIALGTLIGLMSVVLLQRLPLGVQRLLWLQDASVVQSSMRIDLWMQALTVWLSSPQIILIGVGPQRFPLISGYDEPGMYPHNLIFELLAEYGVIGLVIFVMPLLAAVVLGSLHAGTAARTSQAIYFLVYYLVIVLLSGGLQTIWPLFFFAGWFVSERIAR
jgi:O-antigen ligase